MRPVFFSACLLLLTGCGQPAPAQAQIEVADAYAAPSPAGVDMAAGYLTVFNSGPEDRLIAVSSPRAGEIALHTMEMDGVVMRMRMVDSMIAPANGQIVLSPGGDHLMFTGLTAPFAVGEDIPVRLTFQHAGDVDATLPVRSGSQHSGH